MKEYLNDVRQATSILYSRQLELIVKAQAGCLKSRNEVVVANLPLVISIAKRAPKKYPMSDLVAEGNIGLIRAVQLFDTSRDTTFSTYATFWIQNHINHSIRQQSYIHVPVRQYYARIEYWYDPVEDTYVEVHPTEKTRDAQRVLNGTMLSLNRLASESGYAHEEEMSTLLVAVDDPTLELQDDIDSLSRQLQELGPRQRRVLEMRYGIGCEPMTMHQIAELFDITHQRVQQIQEKALRRLRESQKAN